MPLRVLQVIDRPFLGGGQTTVLALARNLDRAKFEVSVCSAAGGPLVEEIRKADIRHFPAGFRKKTSLRTVREISSILRENRVDIVHTHGGVAGFFGRWAAGSCRIPVIVHTLHGIHYLHYRNFFLKGAMILLERMLSRLTDALICVSASDFAKTRKFRLAPEAKVNVIRNGLLQEEWGKFFEAEAKKRELGWTLSSPVIGTVARLHRQKGIIHLLDAAPRILARVPGAKVVVVGGGPLRHKIEREIRKRRLEADFILLGERKDAREILNLFDVFVLPSLWEGLPYALVEAAAAAKPIVATRIDGVSEVVHSGETGLLVPPADAGALADAVVRLLLDKNLAGKLAGRAQETIPPQFSLSRMIEQTEELYLKLWCQKSRGN